MDCVDVAYSVLSIGLIKAYIMNEKNKTTLEKRIEKATAIIFALVAVASLVLAIRNYDNFSAIVFSGVTLFSSVAAYIINEEANEL